MEVIAMSVGHDNVSFMDQYRKPESLSREQRQHFLGVAAVAEVRAAEFYEMYEEQQRTRESALRMAGLLPPERGIGDDVPTRVKHQPDENGGLW
jgi:hypothetical protein